MAKYEKMEHCEKHGHTLFAGNKKNSNTGSDTVYYTCRACMTESQAARVRLNKQKSIEYMGGSCRHCGGTFPGHPEVFEFHHVDPNTKEKGVGNFRMSRSFKKIKEELDKCVMLCANCHRIEHARLRVHNVR